MDITENTETTMNQIHSGNLPALLIGGPAKAGKSVLTYNLTIALRKLDIPHYVFRASPDGEGDWSFEGDLETVREFHEKSKHKWSDIFREIACNDLPHRQLPLIVDIGGRPTEADTCIFQTCQKAILLFSRDRSEQVYQTWHSYIERNHLELLAEMISQKRDAPSGSGSTGPMTPLKPGDLIYNVDFTALVDRIKEIFSRYSSQHLEQWHLSQPQVQPGSVVNLPIQLATLAPENDDDEWTPNLLKPLLASLTEQAAFSIYGRGPAWLYGALALHAGTRPFQQFDPRIGWVTPPSLQAATTVAQATSPMLSFEGPFVNDDTYAIALYPAYNYLDIRVADQLVAPEPQPQRGVIVSGKLPLWLFTALARFYWQRGVPWIAFNDARANQAIVIYSQIATHQPGKRLPMPRIV